MNEIAIRRADLPTGYRKSPDDAPTIHSSLSLVVPDHPAQTDAATMLKLFPKRWEAPDSTFRDAQEYQGRAQDIAETGIPDVPKEDGYRNTPAAP